MIEYKRHIHWNYSSNCYNIRYYDQVDLMVLQEAVINSKDTEWCYRFAVDTFCADINRLQEIVINSGNPEWCFYFAMHVRNANWKKLEEVIFKSGDSFWSHHITTYLIQAGVK